jgi:hypothetical protein
LLPRARKQRATYEKEKGTETMNKTRSGVRLQQQDTRQNISAEAEYRKYSWYAGLLLGLTFGIILFLGW